MPDPIGSSQQNALRKENLWFFKDRPLQAGVIHAGWGKGGHFTHVGCRGAAEGLKT